VFITYTPEEVAELLIAGSKNKKAVVSTPEEKLFASIKYVKLFDEIDSADVLSMVKDVQLAKVGFGDILKIGAESKGRIFYIISGAILMPLGEDSQVELGKDQIFGEVGAFGGGFSHKELHVMEEKTVIFSFKIKKSGLNRHNAEAFVRLYERILSISCNKLSWFEMI